LAEHFYPIVMNRLVLSQRKKCLTGQFNFFIKVQMALHLDTLLV
jgi:hypothetical protein